nr:MAG TPA: hypothetical protein [Caudoviricetes sp.]
MKKFKLQKIKHNPPTVLRHFKVLGERRGDSFLYLRK